MSIKSSKTITTQNSKIKEYLNKIDTLTKNYEEKCNVEKKLNTELISLRTSSAKKDKLITEYSNKNKVLNDKIAVINKSRTMDNKNIYKPNPSNESNLSKEKEHYKYLLETSHKELASVKEKLKNCESTNKSLQRQLDDEKELNLVVSQSFINTPTNSFEPINVQTDEDFSSTVIVRHENENKTSLSSNLEHLDIRRDEDKSLKPVKPKIGEPQYKSPKKFLTAYDFREMIEEREKRAVADILLENDDKILNLQKLLDEYSKKCFIEEHKELKHTIEKLNLNKLQEEDVLQMTIKQNNELENNISKFKDSLAELVSEKNELEERLNSCPKASEIDYLNSQIFDMQKEILDLKHKNDTLASKTVRRPIRGKSGNVEELQKKIKQCENDKINLEFQIYYADTEKDKKLDRLSHYVTKLETRIRNYESEMTERESKLLAQVHQYQYITVENWIFDDQDIALYVDK